MSELSIALCPADLSWTGWDRLLGPVFKTLMVHGSADRLRAWAGTRTARELRTRLADRNVGIEYLMHIASEVLPRRLFDTHPGLFRMNEQWQRVPDANCCVSAPGLERVVAEHLEPYVEALRPTSGRYLLAPDDNRPWCFCRRCRPLSWSDQNLMFANLLARILRRWDTTARVAYVAYKPATDPPVAIRPERNVFLLYAPIERDYRHPLAAGRTARDAYYGRLAHDLLAYFGRRDSQVLEYWLDVSMFSRWMLPRRRIPVAPRVLKADLAFYVAAGFEYISTFGVWLDHAYVRRFGATPVRNFVAAWQEVARL